MSASVSQLKIKFASLLYQRMMGAKYFVETCFSKKYDSMNALEEIEDLRLRIKTNKP